MFLKNKFQLLALCILVCISLIECASVQSIDNQATSIPQITYETHIKSLIRNYCSTCHSGEDPIGTYDLSTYEAVVEKAKTGILLKKINDSNDPMPPSGLLPKEDRVLIETWVKNNYMRKGNGNNENPVISTYEFTPPDIQPIDIEKEGFEFFDQMQGHWVGDMTLMGKKIQWFAFDYRPISPSHIHGIFEGGSIGNLFTSFFVADYKGTKTIVARNGGILSGIYRTSYFVLEKVKLSTNESYYRFVDAYGGQQIMWMELKFKNNTLSFNSYTSRMGTYPKPRKHMIFRAKKLNIELAKTAAKAVGYPKKIVEKDFSKGMPLPTWEKEYPVITSASYLWQDLSKDLVTLGKLAKDPYRIDEIPYLSKVNLTFARNEAIKGKKNPRLFV